MEDMLSRIKMILLDEEIDRIKNAHIAVFGIGGVGGILCESLVRSGIGEISIFDNDVVSISNLNRQIIATTKTIDLAKVDVLEERLLSINPNLIVYKHQMFVGKENIDEIDFTKFTYMVDALDTITTKILLIEKSIELKTPLISSMGTGNKMDPSKLEITDIFKTEVCPLAKVMRYELKKRGIKKQTVLYSKELPVKTGTHTPGSMMFVPASAGLYIASYVLKQIIKGGETNDN